MLEGYCEVNNEEYLAHFLLFILLKFVVQEAKKSTNGTAKKIDNSAPSCHRSLLYLVPPVITVIGHINSSHLPYIILHLGVIQLFFPKKIK